MKAQFLKVVFGVILVFGVLMANANAYVDEAIKFNSQMMVYHVQRAKIEAQLSIDPSKDPYPHATSYYDDLVDHYEQSFLLADEIDRGIR